MSLVFADGTIVAQYDGVPVKGLHPMPAWEVGTPVVDRFAVYLPPDLAPGSYEAHIGLYHPEWNQRLRVTGGDNFITDYLILAGITVIE